jgi:hypothetical protein
MSLVGCAPTETVNIAVSFVFDTAHNGGQESTLQIQIKFCRVLS